MSRYSAGILGRLYDRRTLLIIFFTTRFHSLSRNYTFFVFTLFSTWIIILEMIAPMLKF
jgi:hypothetical protein